MEDERKARLVSRFLGLADFSMYRATSIPQALSGTASGTPGEQAPYREQYKVLKRQVSIPKKYLDTIVDSQFARHFFTQEELNKTRERFLS